MADNQDQSGLSKFHEKARGITAKLAGPQAQVFHQLGKLGESGVSKLVGGGETGAFAGKVLFDPLGAGFQLLGERNDRERDVSSVDPNQLARLREIDRTRKQISSGTDALTQQRISEVRKAGETTKGQLAKFSGGDVGGTISSFLRAQRNVGKGVNQAFQQGQARIPFFENLSTQLGNRISQRKLELDIHEQDRQRAQQAQAQTIANLNESGRQASQGGTGGTGSLGGLIDLVKGSGLISNITGGGQGSLLGGQGGGQNFAGGLVSSIGGGTGQAGGGGIFGQGIGGASNAGAGGFGEGAKSALGSIGGGAASGGGGAGFGELIQKGVGLIGGLFGG